MDKLSAKLPASLQVGKDGVSPIVKVGEIAGGHRITITDVNGELTFDVPDGKDGKSAYDYALEAGYTGDSAIFAKALLAALDRPALLYTEQELTPEQQEQARANIGAGTVKTVNGIAPDENGNVQVETGGGSADLSNYYTKEEIDQLAGELTGEVREAIVDLPTKAYVYDEAERIAKAVVNGAIGDISTALDHIIALQEELINSAVKTIIFTIDGVEYTATKGMTWGEWCRSGYNTIGMDESLWVEGTGYVHLNETQVDDFEEIVAGAEYQLM